MLLYAALGLYGLQFHIVEDIIIQMKLAIEGAIGDPPTLVEEFPHVIEQLIKVHHRPSTCTSAASAWGSQKAMSMARYRAMAVWSSMQASSWRPSSLYSFPRPRWQWAWRGRMPSSSAKARAWQ